MSALSWLLATAGALALLAGWRRSRYDGTPLRVWWAQERMYRSPGHILGRLAKVVFGAACLIGAFVAVLALAGILLAAAAAAGVTVLAWYWLRLAARASTPRVYPVERLDLDQDDDPDVTGPIPAVIWPPGGLPPGRDESEPDPPYPILEV